MFLICDSPAKWHFKDGHSENEQKHTVLCNIVMYIIIVRKDNQYCDIGFFTYCPAPFKSIKSL